MVQDIGFLTQDPGLREQGGLGLMVWISAFSDQGSVFRLRDLSSAVSL